MSCFFLMALPSFFEAAISSPASFEAIGLPLPERAAFDHPAHRKVKRRCGETSCGTW
jgi:hypothetical protein